MLTSAQAFWLQFFVIIATIIAPICSLYITIYIQNRKDVSNSQRNLFLTLYSLRGVSDSQASVNSLNTIEIVYHNKPKVIKAWKVYFEALKDKEEAANWQIYYVYLLSEMATSLGYTSFDNSTFVEHYIPQSLDYIYNSDMEIRKDFSLFLKTQIALTEFLIHGKNTDQSLSDNKTKH